MSRRLRSTGIKTRADLLLCTLESLSCVSAWLEGPRLLYGDKPGGPFAEYPSSAFSMLRRASTTVVSFRSFSRLYLSLFFTLSTLSDCTIYLVLIIYYTLSFIVYLNSAMLKGRDIIPPLFLFPHLMQQPTH